MPTNVVVMVNKAIHWLRGPVAQQCPLICLDISSWRTHSVIERDMDDPLCDLYPSFSEGSSLIGEQAVWTSQQSFSLSSFQDLPQKM